MRGQVRLMLLVFALISLTAAPVSAQTGTGECVVLLHGLARTQASMQPMAKALREDGYKVVNVDYPSRHHPVQELATIYLGDAIAECRKTRPSQVHFVTHSMGGILVRQYLAQTSLPELGRVVMLSPPNQGSEVVDRLRDLPGFIQLNGPAGLQLGTDAGSLPQRLGPVTYPVGVITGNRSININLSLLIPGDDDGKVAVERAKLQGMADFLVVPHSHTWIMKSDQVIHQTRYFLCYGTFQRQVRRGDT